MKKMLYSYVICKYFLCPATIGGNVLGIAEGGEIEAKSFDFAPRRAKTNFCELNLKIKNE